MKRLVFIFTMAFALLSSLGYAGTCGGSVACSCGDQLTSDHVMWYDLANCTGYGITISADNITLNCNNHLIDGNLTGGSFGIFAEGFNGFTIKNCDIDEFTYGIFLQSSSYNTIDSNRASFNTGDGIYLRSSSYNEISNNIANNNGDFNYGSGIILEGSSNFNNIQENFVSYNRDGVWFRWYEGNAPSYNTVEDTSMLDNYIGIYIHSGDLNIVQGNSAISNDAIGIDINSADGNTVKDNFVSENGWNILLRDALYNLVYNNHFNSSMECRNVKDWDGGFNFWNITKTPGTNIVGGPYLGGNYWSDYNGTDTDGDYLGDTELPYTSCGNIEAGGDWLPLVMPASTFLTQCGTLGQEGRTYFLQNDIYTNGTCFNIEADNIRVDCNNFMINHTSEQAFFGENLTNITIENCDIYKVNYTEHWGAPSIYFSNVSNSVVRYNNITNHGNLCTGCQEGIVMYGSDNIIEQNRISSRSSALWVGGTDNVITNNNVLSAAHSLYLGCNNCTATHNNLVHDIVDGIAGAHAVELFYGGSNTIADNYIYSIIWSGISMWGSSSNTITDNDIVLPSSVWNYSAIQVYYTSHYNNIFSNKIQSKIGFWIDLSDNNTIYNNFINTTLIDAYDYSFNNWNITKTPGTNIIGGPYLGGNYWSGYTGIDFDHDGIGDTGIPYTSNNSIVNGGDFLPLTNQGPPPTGGSPMIMKILTSAQ